MQTAPRIQDIEQAALVVAHPDDEVLWFSSILRRVALRVVCFEDCADFPALGKARRKLKRRYPTELPVRWLGIPEPCTLRMHDWHNLRPHRYGIALNGSSAREADRVRQQAVFETIRDRLTTELTGKDDVFTHNPWGEYGHPDHALVCCAVKSLADQLGFRVWYSCYIAPQTLAFAAQFLKNIQAGAMLPTDRDLIGQLVPIYRQASCWTWAWPYTSSESEAFLGRMPDPPEAGSALPLQCVIPPSLP